MLPRRFPLFSTESIGTPADGRGMLVQASFALLAVLALALVAAFATEALAFLAPTDTLAVVP